MDMREAYDWPLAVELDDAGRIGAWLVDRDRDRRIGGILGGVVVWYLGVAGSVYNLQ